MEVKVRLGPTQRTLVVPLYPPPTLAKFQTDVIKLFKLPGDVTLNVSYKNEKNQFIPVHSEGDFNDALKAREKQRPSFQVSMLSGNDKKGSHTGSGRNLAGSAGSPKASGSLNNSSKSPVSKSASSTDTHKKKKEPAAATGPVQGDNPLHEAVRAISQVKVVEVSSQSPSYRTEVNAAGLTPLHLAAQLGHLEIVSLLLASGCLIDEVDMQQNTALHQAAVAGHLAICRSLMQGGANLLLTNNSGCTVLHLLMGCEVSHDEKPLFRILVNDIIRSFRFNMNARNSAGATALHIAASRGYRWNMKVLLMHNPDIGARSKNGDTPLHLAARQGDKKMAQRLLDKGAETDILNEEKLTPLQLAQNYKHAAVVELLTPLTKVNVPAAAPPARTSDPPAISSSTPSLVLRTTVATASGSSTAPAQVSPIQAPSRSAPAQWAPARASPSPTPKPSGSDSGSSSSVSSPAPVAVAPTLPPSIDRSASKEGDELKSPSSKTPSSQDPARPRPHGHSSGRRDSGADRREKDKMRSSSKLPKDQPKGDGSPLPTPPMSVSPLPPPLNTTGSQTPASPSTSAVSPLRDSPNIVVTRDMIQGDGMEAMAQLLKILGLAQWVDRFRQEDIDLSTARELQDDTLQILGLPVGSRLRLIRAIRNIYEPQTPEPAHTTPRKPAAPTAAVVAQQPLDPALAALLAASDLSQYAEVFRLEELTLYAVKRLTDAQLKELGLTMGARIRLLDALSKTK